MDYCRALDDSTVVLPPRYGTVVAPDNRQVTGVGHLMCCAADDYGDYGGGDDTDNERNMMLCYASSLYLIAICHGGIVLSATTVVLPLL